MPHTKDLEHTSIVALASKSNIIMQALHEVEGHYKQGTLAYEEQLKKYTFEIDKYQHQIRNLEKQSNKKEQKRIEIHTELQYEQKLLERLNEQFAQEIKSFNELEEEYKHIVSKEEYSRLSAQKQHTLKATLDEIEDVETTLLSKELEHLNILAVLDPIHKEIEDYQERINSLTLEKEYFSTTQLHKIPQLSLHLNDSKTLSEPVDTEIIENDKKEI